jgi:predicted nucleic acid-binding protein
VYAADQRSPFHEAAQDLREKGLNGAISLCICPQILTEFFAIVTDSRRVDNPRARQEALFEMEKYLHSRQIVKIYPGADTMEIAFDLLRRYEVKKQKIFDLYLVATMLGANVTRLYTYNRDDFTQFGEIEVLSP